MPRPPLPLTLPLTLLLLACGDDATPPTDGGRTTDAARTDAPSASTDGGPRRDASTPPPGDGGVARVDECADAPSEWVFCSGFEEGNLDLWDDYDGNPAETNQLLEDPGPFALAGNHVARLLPAPGRSGADLVKVLDERHDRLFARWYIKWEAGFDFDAPNHGGGLFAGERDFLGMSGNAPDGTNWFTAWVDYRPSDRVLFLYTYYAGMYQDCPGPGSCYGDSFPCVYGGSYCERPEHLPMVTLPVIEADRWYCIETMADGGTPTPSESGASGSLDLFIDGAEIGPWDELWLRSDPDLQLSILWLSLFHHEDHAPVGVVYDHVVVSTERIGCPAAAAP